MKWSLPRPASLRARMTYGFTLAIALLASIICAIFIILLYHTARREALSIAQDAVQTSAQEWGEKPDFADAFAEVEEQARFAHVALMAVDSHNHVLQKRPRFAPTWPRLADDGWLVQTRSVASYTVVAGVYWRETERVLFRQAVVLITLSVVTVIATSLSVWVLVGRTLRPIGAIAEQADNATSDPLHIHLTAPSEDAEVLHLVGTLNGMLHRLREDARAREQFYSAAAHELRTPLAVLSGSLELALSRSHTVPEYQETLHDLRGETKRLISLAEGLLTLNRLQMQTQADARECIDVVGECQLALDRLTNTIRERQISLTEDWSMESALVLAPQPHIAMLVRNLLENAVKYAPIGGTVQVSLRSTHETVRLTIYNDYTNSVPLPFDRLCEPFFRADPSRSIETGGNGLGLAICHRLADGHGWTLQIEPKFSGVLVTVMFPRFFTPPPLSGEHYPWGAT